MPTPEIQAASEAPDVIAEQQAVIENNPLVKANEDRERANAIEFEELQGRAKPGQQRSLFQDTARKLQKAGKLTDSTEFGRFKRWWDATEGKGRGKPEIEYELFKRQTKGMFDEPTQPQIAKGKREIEQKRPESELSQAKSGKDSDKTNQLVKNTVMLPNGDIGEKVSSHKGVATVDVDGKKLQYKDIDLEDPVAVRNAIHEIAQIPEIDRSGPMDLSHYDPKEKKLIVQFPNGKTAVYLDVEPEKADIIRRGDAEVKTTGKTKTGEEWTQGQTHKSHGAALSKQILTNPKYARSQQGITWYFLEEIYDKYGKIRTRPKKKQ
jgi:hypothetical protein